MTLTPQTFSDTDLSALREMFAEGTAKLLGEENTDTPLNNTRQISRVWEIQFDSVSQKQLDYLWLYSSSANALPQQYIDDPRTFGGKTWPGRWRVVSNGYSPKHKGVVQILRLGFADAVNWDEALLVITDDLAVAEGYRTVQWKNCNPSSACAIAASLNVGTISNAVVQGQELSGDWHVIKVTTGHAQDDGSCIINLALAQPEYTLTAYAKAGTVKETATTYFWQVPKLLAAGVLATNKTDGATASVSYPNASGMVDIVIYGIVKAPSNYLNARAAWCAEYRGYTDYYWDLSTEQRDAITLTLTEPARGWIYHYSWTLTGDGLWDIRIEKHHALDQESTSNSQTAFDTTTVVSHTENATALPAPSPKVGFVKSNQNANTISGNYATHENVKEVIESVITFTSAITDKETTTTEKGRNAEGLPVLDPVAGVSVRLDGDKNDAQLYDYSMTTVSAHVPLSCPEPVSWDVYGDIRWVPRLYQDPNDPDITGVGNLYLSDLLKYVYLPQRQQQVDTHTISFFLTAEDAAGAIAGGRDGSHISQAGDNLWMAYKVTFVVNTLEDLLDPPPNYTLVPVT